MEFSETKFQILEAKDFWTFYECFYLQGRAMNDKRSNCEIKFFFNVFITNPFHFKRNVSSS